MGMSTLDMREFSIFGQPFKIHEDLFKHGDNDWASSLSRTSDYFASRQPHKAIWLPFRYTLTGT